jgi:hypothetical protein
LWLTILIVPLLPVMHCCAVCIPRLAAIAVAAAVLASVRNAVTTLHTTALWLYKLRTKPALWLYKLRTKPVSRCAILSTLRMLLSKPHYTLLHCVLF